MNDKVLENNEFEEKISWQRKTYPLKLMLTDLQIVKIENMIYEYKKGINKIIDLVLRDFFPNHLTMLPKEDWSEDVCLLCGKKKKLSYRLIDFRMEKYAEKKGKPIYKPVFKRGNKINICGGCACSHYTLRKFFLPSSKREVPIKEWDFTKNVRLGKSSSIYDSCLQKAVETIKSDVEIRKKIDYKIEFYKKRLLDNTVKLNQSDDKEDKRKYRNFIRWDEKAIQKEENKKSEGIIYKNDAIRLYENAYKIIEEDGDYYIKLKDYSRDSFMTLGFYGKDYQKKLAKKFIKTKKAETEIVRKGDDFYLQYIYRQESKVPIPDKTFTAIGIDVNIINLACLTSCNKDGKAFNIKFYSGRNMRDKRKRFREMRGIWNTKTKYKENGGRGRSRKWFKDKCEHQAENKYVKFLLHKLSTDIVHYVKETYDKPVIVLENLKDIRDRIGTELKITKCSIEKLDKNQQKKIRGEKLLNAELNNWNFADFQKFLEYKANWMGIPVVYVSAKNTSIQCNKCGHTDEENYENYHNVSFVCKKCGYSCNADFNAAINIARRFYV